MMAAPRRRRLSRGQKVWLSVSATFIGLLAITFLAVKAADSQDTDLVDPTIGVTSDFKTKGEIDLPDVRFADVTREVGVRVLQGPGPRARTLPEDTGSGVAWGDYDGDGDWDLYVVNFPGPLGAPPDPEGSNYLYRNDEGQFTDVTAQAGVSDLAGFGMGASFADYDDDGDLDLYVTNYGPNRLFRNRGDGTFEDVAQQAGVADPQWSTGAAWGDFDRDGHLDLYVCNYVDFDEEVLGDDLSTDTDQSSVAVPFTLNPNSFDPQPNRLYRNLGDGAFMDVAAERGVSNARGRSLSATLCDLDGDGWLDLYINNDVSTNRLYRNAAGDFAGDEDSASKFLDLSAITGTADPRGSMGLSVLEIGAMNGKADGLPDLFITHWVAQENAFYQSIRVPGGGFEYRDKTRHFRLGEVSIDTVGWGSSLVDFDLDGRPDLVVVNGSTLEEKKDYRHLRAEPMFLFWNDGSHFVDVAPLAGDATARARRGRGLAAADFDGDGDVDLAVAANRGELAILRNETETSNRSLVVILEAPAAAMFGAKVVVRVGDQEQIQWYGADVSFLSNHAPELIFGLGDHDHAEELSVVWANGRRTLLPDVPAGRLVVRDQR
jgi:enediyne biosynthesis protein E4